MKKKIYVNRIKHVISDGDNRTPLTALFLVLTLFSAFAFAEQLNDTLVCEAVETELLYDFEVSSHNLDIACNDGIITLSGTADNILEKERAADLAGLIKGVRSVINRIEVANTKRNDNDIALDVKAALAKDPATDAYELDVKVNDGIVQLSGKAESYQERMLSATVAKGVRGVQEVRNGILVDIEPTRADKEIEADIRRRLLYDIRIDAGMVDIKVEDGGVMLSGAVGSWRENRLAFDLAHVAGVKEVHAEELEINWRLRDKMRAKRSLDGKEIETALREAFALDPRLSATSPHIRVDDGLVVLTGEVSDYAAKQAAYQTAQNTSGVNRVNNLLRVRPSAVISDSTVEADVLEAIRRDSYLERLELEVHVFNAKAYVYGRVNSAFEKKRALNVVSHVPGVVDVENNIQVLKSSERSDDHELESVVETRLRWNPYIEERNIEVEAENGIVTMRNKGANSGS